VPVADDGGRGDPFDDVVFDEDFVRSAQHTEASAADRVARLQRIDRAHRDLRDDAEAQRHAAVRDATRERRRGRRRPILTVAVVAAVLVAAVIVVRRRPADAAAPDDAASGPPASEALTPDTGGTAGADGSAATAQGADRPLPGHEEHAAPLGTPPPAPSPAGPYAFLQTKPDGQPVAYDPCRPIHVVVNSRTAPPGADALLAEALQRLSAATGLQFVVDGATDEPVRSDSNPPVYEPDRYPDRWAPVLVVWTDEREDPALAGTVAGRGGSEYVPDGDVYVTGQVALDGPDFVSILARPNGHALARTAVLHELGHLVGLAHVSDPTQVMSPGASASATGEYASGDLAGLSRLGQGPCVPSV
jgi:hypothetical protein